MVSRLEYLYLKNRLNRLVDALFDFENKSDVYLMWIKYQNMNTAEKVELHKAWDVYYQKAHDGHYGQIFAEARKALAKNDVATVKRLSEEAKHADVSYIKRPSSIDPTEIDRTMAPYFLAKNEAMLLKKQIEELAPIYESKKGESSL